VEAGLRMNDSVPALLSQIRADVTLVEWTLINRLGLSGVCYYSRIAHNHAMLQALIERWNLEKNTFYLPTGEMIVTLEDVFHILRLPFTGKPGYQALPSTARGAITAVFGPYARDLTQRGLSFTYGIMYAAHLEETRLAVILMIA
ncbi:hypothetical protein KI387_022189, partial [Taxus chinensis]